MGFLEDFQASVEALPAMLHRNYSLLRELDKSLQGVQLENEQRCQQEIEDIKHGLESRSITFDPAKLKFSDEATEEQKHCVRIADEKVALATQTYDLVDAHIQQLDQFMRKLEELRQEKEAAAAVAAGTAIAATATATATASAGASTAVATPKSGRSGERGRGGRKKAKVPTQQPGPAIDLELPVDPNEPTYCLCNQVSYGEMVACDNPDCKIEWFHFGCVGLKEQPKGKWYCPNCIGFQKKRKGK
ncbi:PHD finger protein ING1 [Phragmites australis]|uniref:PHD finger protein ING1 n=1 Tax=Phragmites australis TaxID=29695 RepID=UPI002D7A2F29|nr:PHD finger protein ING1 [Phragmites australis]